MALRQGTIINTTFVCCIQLQAYQGLKQIVARALEERMIRVRKMHQSKGDYQLYDRYAGQALGLKGT